MGNTTLSGLKDFHQNFINPFGYDLSSISLATEKEAQIYQAATFHLNNLFCLYRVAKTTQNRPGQFVTLWKRNNEKIEPFDVKDGISYVVIATKDPIGKQMGFFIFPEQILLEKKILSNTKEKKKGKLAFRIFPPWSENFISKEAVRTQRMSASASKSQRWQLKYFFSAPNKLLMNPFANS